jgi:hypothetical protein
VRGEEEGREEMLFLDSSCVRGILPVSMSCQAKRKVQGGKKEKASPRDRKKVE